MDGHEQLRPPVAVHVSSLHPAHLPVEPSPDRDLVGEVSPVVVVLRHGRVVGGRAPVGAGDQKVFLLVRRGTARNDVRCTLFSNDRTI